MVAAKQLMNKVTRVTIYQSQLFIMQSDFQISKMTRITQLCVNVCVVVCDFYVFLVILETVLDTKCVSLVFYKAMKNQGTSKSKCLSELAGLH